MDSKIKSGFYYDLEWTAPDGTVTRDRVHNLVPTEGLNLIAGVLFKGVAVPAAWYIGLLESNYTPTAGVTAANLASVATESLAYSESTRRAFTGGTVVGGALDNAAAPAVFTFTADKTIYGGFISSASAKGSATGTLVSIAAFTPKPVNAGTVLRVTTGFAQA